jgi:hypothetical protein
MNSISSSSPSTLDARPARPCNVEHIPPGSTPLSDDEVLAEVHRQKDAIAEENQFDLEKLFADLKGRQEKNPRLVRLAEALPAGK